MVQSYHINPKLYNVYIFFFSSLFLWNSKKQNERKTWFCFHKKSISSNATELSIEFTNSYAHSYVFLHGWVSGVNSVRWAYAQNFGNITTQNERNITSINIEVLCEKTSGILM
jgi:hypothetical protein